MTTVILAEKPSVAMDIGKVVGATSRRDGYLESRNGAYKVTWAFGHLVELAAPEEIRAEWRRWSALPILPESFPLVPRRDGKNQLKVIERLFKSRSTKLLVNAADAGREGELIFRYILEWIFDAAPCDKPIMRFWASSLTEEAIKEALAAMRPARDYDRLAHAARWRSRLDWLVGMNGTRALRSFGGRTGLSFEERKGLTVGRVQTPTLAMIARLDDVIGSFVPRSYSEVHATFACSVPALPSACVKATYVVLREAETEDGKQTWDSKLWPPASGAALSPVDDPEQVAARARSGVAGLTSVQRESKAYRPQLLFDLTSLQREANVRWGWAASRTLAVTQELYERHKLLSYPRTDSRHLSTTVAEQLPTIVQVIRGPYEAFLAPDTGRAALSRRFVDDSKVGDHHAIIPTLRNPAGVLADRTDASKLFDLVCRRLLAAWQPDCVEAVSEVVFEVHAAGICDRYRARGTEVVQLGWRGLEPKTNAGAVTLPAGLRVQRPATVGTVVIEQKKTRPPSHFSDATLLSAMESAGRALQGEAAEAMRDRGLGTPATRAAIIEALVARGYVTRAGRFLKSTALGTRLVASVPDLLTSAELTGDMEARLRRIERGGESAEAFASDVHALVCSLVEEHRPTPTGHPAHSENARR